MPQQKFNPADWDVVDDQWEDIPNQPTAPVTTPPAEKGWLSKAWSAVSDPLWEGPSRFAKQVSDSLTQHTADESMLGSMTRGFIGGATEGLGNVLSSLTSPLSLATLGTGGLEVAGAKAGMPQVARLASIGTKALSAPVAAHGAVETFSPDSSWGDRAMGLLEMAGGGAGMVHTPPAVRPKVNPALTRVAEDIPAGPIAEKPINFETVNEPRPSVMEPESVALKTEDDVNNLVKGLGLGDEWEAVNTPIDEVAGPLNNASGESDASLEAIKRAQSLKRSGQQFVVYTKTGEKKILGRGVDAHDYVAQGYLKDGESFGLEDKQGNFQLLDDRGGKIPSSTKTVVKEPTAPSKTDQFLQRDLRGAKPRFNIGTDSYTPVFANDLDKALYIIAQKNPSRRDADFLRFVMNQTGLDEAAARAAGLDVRKAILKQVAGQEPGEVAIPQIFGKTQVEPVTQITPETLAAGGSGAGTPPSGPPRPPSGPSGSTPPPSGGQPPSGGPKPPVVPQQVPGALQQVNQQARLANPAQKAGLFQNAQAFIKTLLTSYDVSAPGRQGKGLITHKEFWTSLDDMFKAWGSEKASQAVQDSIVNHPSGYFKPRVSPSGKALPSIAEEAGLAIGDKGRPEMFGSKLAEKLPGVKASERAYTAFLTKARADTFAKLASQAQKLGRGTPDVFKQIADSINISTGVGNLHGVEHSATAMKTLNSIFFAPKLMASRVQMYTRVLNPKTYTTLDPIVRKEALRSLFGVVGTGLVLGEIAKGMGATVVNDPTNSDFRKIKVGNTRIDNFAGLQQYGVAAARLLTGESTSSVSGRTSNLEKPKFGGQTRQDVVSNFLTNKLAPIPSFVWAWMGNKEFDGTPFEVKQAMLQRVVPLVIQDLYDIAKEDPSLIPMGLLPMFGEGVQTYGR